MSTKNFLLASLFCLLPFTLFANPIKDLLERIDPGASKKFVIQLQKNADKDFFELDPKKMQTKISSNLTKKETKWWYAEIHTSISQRD